MHPMHPFRRAVEAKDLASVASLLAPDIVFRSPITFSPFQGRDAVIGLLKIVITVFEDFRYLSEIVQDDHVVLVFEARVGDKTIQGIDLLRTNPAGLITEFTVMLRPLKATLAFAEAMKSRLLGADVSRV